MKILVIGGGGREHAICWKLCQSKLVSEVHCAPGNGGTYFEEGVTNHLADSIDKWLKLAKHLGVDFTVVGPEQPLAEGITDIFNQEKLPIIGPCKSAALLESSKVFAKKIMSDAGIPTANSQTFNDFNSAKLRIAKSKAPYVIKANGLAAGKGVVIASNKEEAELAINEMLVQKNFGEAGKPVSYTHLTLPTILRV